MTSDLPRTNLPMPDQRYSGPVAYDAKNPTSGFPPIEPVRPPAGAPNVLLILLDDLGFGASSAFGGPCAAPVMERLAASGLRYNRFHTAPTPAALLSGRNHHTAGMGSTQSSPRRLPAIPPCARDDRATSRGPEA